MAAPNPLPALTVGLSLPILKPSSAEIRVLELLPPAGESEGSSDAPIHAEYHVVDLDTATPVHLWSYETLSYAWGDPNTIRPKTIYIQSTLVSISSTLFSAIKKLRYPTDSRPIWIDQLCINQADLQEKTSQVNMMGKIYSKRAMCNIWLGDLGHVDRSNAEDALDLLSFFAGEKDEQRPSWLADKGRRDNVVDLINHLVSLPWWYRVWTVQEAVLPRLSQFTKPVIGIVNSGNRDSPHEILTRWRYRKATNPLDKVYALVGFRDDLARKLPSFGSCDYALAPRTLFTRASADVIHQYGTLEPLIGKLGETTATEGLPSWATDYAGARPGTPDLYDFWPHNDAWVYRRYNAGTGIEGPAPVVENYRVLRLTGMCVDIINIVQETTAEDHRGCRPIHSVDEYMIGIGNRMTSDSMQCVFKKWLQREGSSLGPVATAKYDEFWEELIKLLKGEVIPDTPHGQEWRLLQLWCADVLPNQAVFITRSGFFGLGPLTTKPGQDVWVLAHSKFPFIMAPLAQEAESGDSSGADSDEYSMVGDCFVRGIMMGEALQRSSTSEQRNIRVL